MLKKRQLKQKKMVRVTFALPPDVEGKIIHVQGDFNDWKETHPMKQRKDGGWQIAVDLEPGGEYQFRYLVDEQWWLNDPQADGYVPNPYGEQNSIVTT